MKKQMANKLNISFYNPCRLKVSCCLSSGIFPAAVPFPSPYGGRFPLSERLLFDMLLVVNFRLFKTGAFHLIMYFQEDKSAK